MDNIGSVLGLALYLSALVSLFASLSGVSISLPYVLTSELECAFSSIYNSDPKCSLAFGCSSALDYDLVLECNSAFIVCDLEGIEIC